MVRIHAGVIYPYIDMPESLDCHVAQFLHRIFVGDIQGEYDGTNTQFFTLLSDLYEFLDPTGRQNYVVSLVCEF
jgi:hypothetical protein